MTSPLHKAIKQVLKEVDNFLTHTLKDQNLNKLVQKERTKVIDSIQKLYNDFAVIKPTLEKEETRSKPTPALEKIGSQQSEDDISNEYNIPQTTVSSLKDPTKNGYLFQRKPGEGKQKLFKQKKETKKYCVIHENVMYWFIKPSDKSFHGAVYLNECELEDVSRKDKEFIFQLIFPSNCSSHEFQADNKEDLQEWMKAVEKGIQCGKQKNADAVDGNNLYEFDAVSTATTSREVTYINELPAEEEEGSVYWEPDLNPSTADRFKESARDLRSSIPRQRPPSPPKSAFGTLKQPFLSETGKAVKESKPGNTSKIDKSVPGPQGKLNKSTLPIDSKNSPKNNPFLSSSSAKPKTISEVKLKKVSMPAGLTLCEDEFKNDDNIYETVENMSGVDAAGGIPAFRPPPPPQRGGNVYVNETDSDHLIYEIP